MDIAVTLSVNKPQLDVIDKVAPLADIPETVVPTSVQELPLSILYCHLLKVAFCTVNVKSILEGLNVTPPSVLLNTFVGALILINFELLPFAPATAKL